MKTRINSARWLENQKRWQLKIQKNGVRKTFTSSTPGRKGQRIVHQKADAWLAENVQGGSVKFNIVIDRFLKEKSIYLKPRSVYKYETAINKHIRPYIGYMRVENLTEQTFQDILNDLYDKGYALETIKGVKLHMQQLIKFARKCGYTTLVFENLEVRSKAEKRERRVFSYADIKTILNDDTTEMYGKTAKEKYINLFRFMLLTGVRRGEAFGLKWSDIGPDFIQISRSVTPQREIVEPKTKNSRRLIPVTPLISKILNDVPRVSDYVFNDDNLSLSASGVNLRFKKYCQYHNLAADRLHELRHTFISLNLKTLTLTSVKTIVGHSANFDTVETYGHLLEDDLIKSGKEIEKNFTSLIN